MERTTAIHKIELYVMVQGEKRKMAKLSSPKAVSNLILENILSLGIEFGLELMLPSKTKQLSCGESLLVIVADREKLLWLLEMNMSMWEALVV